MSVATAKPPLVATPGSHPVLVSGLRRAYGERVVLDNLALAIGDDEFVALLGPSGCGKSTLLRVLAGLDEPDAGSVFVPARRAIVFQEPRLLPWKRVWRNVGLGVQGADVRGRALRALAEVGLATHADAFPKTLSGGEAQRVALARALIAGPALLLLDEPFAAVDALTRMRMHDLVRDLRARHRPAVLLVTHDVDEAIALADRIAVMRDGRILEEVTVALDSGARRHGQRREDLRTRLLELLGVLTEHAAAPVLAATQSA